MEETGRFYSAQQIENSSRFGPSAVGAPIIRASQDGTDLVEKKLCDVRSHAGMESQLPTHEVVCNVNFGLFK